MKQNRKEEYTENDNMHLDANPIIFQRAKQLRIRMTKAEEILWEELRNKKLNGIKFRRQHPISRYILVIQERNNYTLKRYLF